MRFSLLTVGALAAGSIAAPVLSHEKRQVGNILQLVGGLYTQVTSLTASINATLLGVNASVDANVDLDKITVSVTADIAAIVMIVDTALNLTVNLTNLVDVDAVLNITAGLTKSLPAVGSPAGLTNGLPAVGSPAGLTNSLPAVGGLRKRQAIPDVGSVVHVVTSLIAEISATIGGVTKVVPGLELTDATTLLTGSLDNLLDDLEDNIVEGVIEAVASVFVELSISNILNVKINV